MSINSKMQAFLSFLVHIILFNHVETAKIGDEYAVPCIIELPVAGGYYNLNSPKRQALTCHTALFAQVPFEFNGSLGILQDDLCDIQSLAKGRLYVDDKTSNSNLAVAVRRGNCSFVTKASNALSLNISVLVIINTDVDSFAMGPAEMPQPLYYNYTSDKGSITHRHLAVVMTSRKLWDISRNTSIVAEKVSYDGYNVRSEEFGNHTAYNSSVEPLTLETLVTDPTTASSKYYQFYIQYGGRNELATVPRPSSSSSRPQGTISVLRKDHESSTMVVRVNAMIAGIALLASLVLVLGWCSSLHTRRLQYVLLIRTQQQRQQQQQSLESLVAPEVSANRFGTYSTSYSHMVDNVVKIAVFIFIILVFIVFRMGTLRVHDYVETTTTTTTGILHGSKNGGDTRNHYNNHNEYNVMEPFREGDILYDHRETDEVVFEALVYYVLRDWRDYTLQGKPIIQALGLAEENYSDALFIHPPMFVYVSAVLRGYLGVSMPIIPILWQLVTLLCIPFLVQRLFFTVGNAEQHTHLDGSMKKEKYYEQQQQQQQQQQMQAGQQQLQYGSDDSVQQTSSSIDNVDVRTPSMLLMSFDAALQAMLCFLCCPILAFCSQKFWIDNALMCGVTLSVTAHMLLTAASHNTAPQAYQSSINHFASGFIFGLFGLNCKITSLALVPFLVLWIAMQQLQQVCLSIQSNTSNDRFRCNVVGVIRVNRSIIGIWLTSCAIRVGLLILGMGVAYFPWGCLYWYYTGRYTPNAWPSPTMLERSSFVRNAVNKPFYTYLWTLLKVSPVHIVAILFTLLLVGHALVSIWLFREKLFLSDSVVSSASSLYRAASADDAVDSDGDNSDQSTSNDAYISSGRVTRSKSKKTSEFAPSAQKPRANMDSGKKSKKTYSYAKEQETANVRRSTRSTRQDTFQDNAKILNTNGGDDGASVDNDGRVEGDYCYPISLLQLQYWLQIGNVLVFAAWPVAFLFGLTLVASMGSGFQTRFLTPMLPGSIVLFAISASWVQSPVPQQSDQLSVSSRVQYSNTDTSTCAAAAAAASRLVLTCILGYSSLHAVYYCLFYAPLYAELDVSLVDMLAAILQHPYHPPSSRDEFTSILAFMKHYGLVRM